MAESGPDPKSAHKAPRMPATPQVEPPHWSLWLLYLVFKPRRFFETYVLKSIPALTVLSAWLFGASSAIERFENKQLFSGDNPVYESMAGDWTMYAAYVAVLGAISGALYFAVGGWWYRLRLTWSGAQDPDIALARRVYLYSAQAYAVPMVLYAVWQAGVYATPAAAVMGSDSWWMVTVAGLFWSVYVSYRGVRTAFDVKRWRARWWFFILPGLTYAAAMSAVIGAMLFASADLERAPDTGNSQVLDRPGFTLEYPGNWYIDTSDSDYDPDYDFSVEPRFADAMMNVWFYTEPMESQACVDETVANLRNAFEVLPLEPVERWGNYTGAGWQGAALIDGGEYRLFLFCSTERERPFEIMEITEQAAVKKLEPGYRLIRESFELRP